MLIELGKAIEAPSKTEEITKLPVLEKFGRHSNFHKKDLNPDNEKAIK